MESSSRVPALEMNGKDKRNGPSEEVSFQLVAEYLRRVQLVAEATLAYVWLASTS